MSFAFFLFIYIYGGINAFYYFFLIFNIHKKILYRTIYLKINYILKCLHKSLNLVSLIQVFLCLYPFRRRKRFYMYQPRFIYRITFINLLYYCFNMPRDTKPSYSWGAMRFCVTWTWADCEGAMRFNVFLTSQLTLITRCTRSKPRCTISKLALNSCIHSRTSLHTLKPPCILPNIASYSQTWLQTLKPRCTFPLLAAHPPFSSLNFNKIIKAQAPPPQAG